MKLLQSNKGSSLIETVVALFVLAIGVLGVLSMQVKSVQFNKNSHLYSQASYLANDIYEGMLVTPDIAETYAINYDDTTPSKPSCRRTTDNCNAEEIVSWNLHNWRKNIQNLLPGGRGEINNIDGQLVIRVEFEMGYDQDGAPQAQEYVMVTDI